MLDRLAKLRFGQRDAFAQVPQRLALRDVRGDGRVVHQARLDGLAQHGLETLAGVGFALAVGQLQQGEPRRGR